MEGRTKMNQEGLLLTLPQEVLEKNICQNLNMPSLTSLSQSCRFFYNSLQEYKKRRPEVIRHNLQHLNCNKRIFNGQEEVIYGVATWRNALITSSRSTVKAWNADTGENLWAYSDELKLCEKLWMVDGRVICAGRQKSGTQAHCFDIKVILILDSETGLPLTVIKNPLLNPELTTVVGNQIIGKLKNGEIICWNLSGTQIKSYQSILNASVTPIFLATDFYIVDVNSGVYNTAITIITRESGETVTITLNNNVYSVSIADNLLICGISSINSTSPNIVIVDLQQGRIIDEYKTQGLLHRSHPTYGTTENSGCIQSVAAKNGYVFMAHESGIVVSVDFRTRTHQVLENDLTPHSPYLSLQDNYLFIKSSERYNRPSSLHIWDIESMKKVNTVDISGLQGVKWHKGELLVSAERSLIKYDFKILDQKGEILAEGSPDKLENASRTGECIMM